MEAISQELIRAIRDKRTQRAFARRLGYRANPITDWETGRRYPTAGEMLRACTVAGIDVGAAAQKFYAPSAEHLGTGERDEQVAAWLNDLRGSLSIAELARRAGASRFSVGRWLAGTSRPRLPDFLRLLEAITARLSDFVAALVPIDRVPSLVVQHEARAAARRLAFDEPWTEAILRLLEIEGASGREDWIARGLRIDVDTVRRCIARLAEAGAIINTKNRWEVAQTLTVDTRASAEQTHQLHRHWAEVAQQRLEDPGQDDSFRYNVFSMSRDDYERVEALLAATYREVRAIIAASEPCEIAGLLNLHFIAW